MIWYVVYTCIQKIHTVAIKYNPKNNFSYHSSSFISWSINIHIHVYIISKHSCYEYYKTVTHTQNNHPIKTNKLFLIVFQWKVTISRKRVEKKTHKNITPIMFRGIFWVVVAVLNCKSILGLDFEKAWQLGMFREIDSKFGWNNR